jgi:coenzyme F420-reducing hydrogenase delta subunit/ferredoxin
VSVPFLESTFLNGSPISDELDLNSVMVVGDGILAVRLAERLSAEGFDVCLVGKPEPDRISDRVSTLSDATLVEVRGFVGRFEAVLETSEGTSIEHVGFIVSADSPSVYPKFRTYGLTPSERVPSLSEAEQTLSEGTLPFEPRGDIFHAAFLCGLEGESGPETLIRVLDLADAMQQMDRVQTYIFTRQVKVAAAGLEGRYRESRERGAIYFKFDGSGPVYEGTSDPPAMVFHDPVLNVEMELLPDLIVVDEELRPPDSLKPLLKAIPSSAYTGPFLQPESTRFPAVKTAKAGILALGASRGVFVPDLVTGDIDAVIVALKSARQEAAPSELPAAAAIDPAKCTMCLTCVRLCPHGAISFHTSAQVDPTSCARCGICASACPMEAIILAPPEGETDMASRIKRGLEGMDVTKRIVAFLCRQSAVRAMHTAGPALSQGVAPIVVPCAGTLDLAHILTAFQEGAAGVLVAGCHPGNCASVFGTVLARDQTALASEMLEGAGIDPSGISYVSLASNTPGDFVRALRRLQEEPGVSGVNIGIS